MPMKIEDTKASHSELGQTYKRPSRGLLRSLGSSLLFAPLNLLNLVAVNGVSVLRPYAPQLVPIVVYLFLIPFAVCLSLLAGWKVWNSLSVGWEVPLYLQYGERLVPYALAAIPPIQAHQPYVISLHMRLPVSDSNISLGNFMATLTLMTQSNQTLATISRPALLLPPKSSWVFGTPNAINLDMTLFNSFVSKTSDILAYIEVGRRDGWRSIGDGRGREVSILVTALRGKEIPRGIRGLAIRFPLVASSLAACMFLLILSLMIGTCVLPMMFPIPIDEDDTEHQAKIKNHSKSNSSPPPASTPHARSSSTPLRRRRSRITRRFSGSSRAVVPETGERTDDSPSAAISISALLATESAPEVSAHTAGPSGETAEKGLRRRLSRQSVGSDEDRRQSSSHE